MRKNTKESTPNPPEPFELFMGCLGNGITVCNKAVIDPETRDFKMVAHINKSGIVNWYVRKNTLPIDAINRIENEANVEHQRWLAVWDSYSDLQRYSQLLELMTCSELVSYNQWLRVVPKPRSLPWIVGQILTGKMCCRANTVYGL